MEITKRRTIVEIVDERSMLTCDVVGAAERHTAQTAHGGSHDNEDWGGIPVVIFVGDDYQLPPPTNTEKGAFDLMDSKTSFSQQKLGEAALGAQVILDLSEKCVELKTIKRQGGDQNRFKEALDNLRMGNPTEADASYMMDLHLANMSAEQAKRVSQEGVVMHLFATKAPRDEFNLRRLSQDATNNNPAALIKAEWKSCRRLNPRTMTKHYDNPPQNASILCRGATVKITGKNFEPDWGLYNNGVGIVQEIVFQPRKDPNNGDQPAYVAVRFETYSGPIWDENAPKVVPVPMVTRRCNNGCCTVTYCPLELSYGMTAHTFQGQSAGPVSEGQPKNAVDRIIFDPGNRMFEGNNPGTLYMGASRATTTGNENEDSALYFSGQNMNKFRVLNITLQRDRVTPYKKVRLRTLWVERLEQNTITFNWSEKKKKELITWAKTFKMDLITLEKALSRRKWRKNGLK